MFIRGHIVTPSAVVPGVLGFFEQIVSIKAATDVAPRYIVPGFVDLHVHGGGGGDTMDGVAGIETMARFHLTHGTTSLLPTTITNPWPDVLAALRAVAEAQRRDADDGAGILGAHLEGPFINPERLGAQPPFTILPEEQRVAEALDTGIVRVVTLAPEVEHGMEAAKQFARAGVRVSLGHSTADYAHAKAAIASVVRSGGIAGGTHLYNAMGGMEGRTPGLVGALLGSGQAWAELILDLHHVHPGAFLAAYAAMGDRLFLITDAIRGTGLGDGESELGGRKVTIRSGVARLRNGSLAGSVLTMDTAFRNALAQGLTLPQAARLTSTNPAQYLGITDRGAIMPGQRADFVVLDTQMRVVEVWREGRRRI